MLADLIRTAIRNYILNFYADEVANDIALNGLTVADEAIIQAILNAP